MPKALGISIPSRNKIKLADQIYQQALREYASDPQNSNFRPRTDGGPSSPTSPVSPVSPVSPSIPFLPIITSFPPVLEGDPDAAPQSFTGGEILKVLAHKTWGTVGGLLYCILWKPNDPGAPAISWWVTLSDMMEKKSFIEEYHLRNRLGPVPWPGSGKRRRTRSSASLGVKEIKTALEDRKAELVRRGMYMDDAAKLMMMERWMMREEWQRVGRGWGTAKEVVQKRKRIWLEMDARDLIGENERLSRESKRGSPPDESDQQPCTPSSNKASLSEQKSEPALRPLQPETGESTVVVTGSMRSASTHKSVNNTTTNSLRRMKQIEHAKEHHEWRHYFGLGSTSKREGKQPQRTASSTSLSSDGSLDSGRTSLLGLSPTTVAMLKGLPKKAPIARAHASLGHHHTAHKKKHRSHAANLDGVRNSMESFAESLVTVASVATAPQKKTTTPRTSRNILARLFGKQRKERSGGRRGVAFYTEPRGRGDPSSSEAEPTFHYPPDHTAVYDSRLHSSVQLAKTHTPDDVFRHGVSLAHFAGS